MKFNAWIGALCATAIISLVAHLAHSQEQRSIDSRTSVLDQVLVVGHKTGPKIWRVTRTREEDNHTLWVFATPPVLLDTEWDSMRAWFELRNLGAVPWIH